MCIDWVSKVRLDKTARCLSVWGQKKPSWDKTAIFLSVWRPKNAKTTKVTYNYILDTIESESTTRSKNRSSDHMMTSDWLVDVSDDRCTTNMYYDTFYRKLTIPWSPCWSTWALPCFFLYEVAYVLAEIINIWYHILLINYKSIN